MRKNINWPYVAGLFDSCGSLEFVLSGPSSLRGEEDGRDVPNIAHAEEEVAKYLVRNLGGVYYTGPEIDPETGDDTGKTVHIWRAKGHKNRLRFFEGVLAYSQVWTEALKEALVNESVETNTFCAEVVVKQRMAKIESELMGDHKSVQEVTPDA